MRFIIIGPQGAGKSTFGAFLAEALGTQATDTSAWLVEVEKARQEALVSRYLLGSSMPSVKPGEEDVALRPAWDHSRNRPSRELLVALGDAVNSQGPTFLVDRCFEKGNIAMGVRRKSELEAVKLRYPGVIVVYIDREVGEERAKDNLELTSTDTEHVIVRTVTLEGAKKAAKALANIAQDGLKIDHLVLVAGKDSELKLSTF